MSKLPPNASLENLKKQAKQLFKSYQDGWAFAWPSRGAAWIHRHRSTLQNAIT